MEGLLLVVALLALGYVLLLLELFVPGGILGILGLASIIYGCWLAFGLGPYWGGAAVGLSLLVTVLGVIAVVRSRAARRLVLDTRPSRQWKAPSPELAALVGSRGVTRSPLRPAGIVEIADRRLDVVTDSEFLEAGVEVTVTEVEGSRVVVEAAVNGGATAPGSDSEE